MNEALITNCEQALRLLAEHLDHELSESQHESVEHHLRQCRSCYSRAEFERRLKAELREIRRERIRPEFQQRIRELITQFVSSDADEPRGG